MTAVQKGIERGDRPVVQALLRAGGRLTPSAVTELVGKHREWLPDLAALIPADPETIENLAFHGTAVLDTRALHWDQATREALLATRSDELP